MKNLFILSSLLFCSQVIAQEESVLVNTPVVAAPITIANGNCVNGSCKKVTYKNRRFISPNATPNVVDVSRCETSCDACCNPVTVKTTQGVEICAPACSCQEDVRTSLNGKRKVYDYGKYEVVVTDKKDEIQVKYRRRLLSR